MGVPLACRGYVLVENCISTRSAHFSTVFFHTCLKLGNRQSGQAVFAWGRDFHTLFHTLWKTGFCGFVAGCRTGTGYDIFCDFCIIGLACLLGYLVNRVGLWGGQGGGRLPTLPCRNPAGACLFGCLPAFYFSFVSAPIPPTPFPAGRGRFKVYFAGGYRPRHPGIRPLAALTEPPKQAPGGGVPSASPVRRKTDRIAFLSAMPAAKERGDRGRGTSAFEMVLSPGAGIASAAGKSALRAQGWGLSFPAGEGGQEGKLKAG